TTVELSPIVIEGGAPPPGTATSAELAGEARGDGEEGSGLANATRTLDAIAGGTAVVASQEMPPQAGTSLSEALAFVPGVVVQDFFGSNDQPRLQIRGSGLQQNPSERGTLVLQDGLPINRADGSYIVGLADPKSAAFMEVYRGYTANRLGATVLGGAI